MNDGLPRSAYNRWDEGIAQLHRSGVISNGHLRELLAVDGTPVYLSYMWEDAHADPASAEAEIFLARGAVENGTFHAEIDGRFAPPDASGRFAA